MAKSALFAALLILFSSTAFGLVFSVQVEDVTEHSFKGLEFKEEVQTAQRINGTVENIGSIGCKYRLKGEFERGNDTVTRYSSPASLFQGGFADFELYYVPMNYTGEVDTSLYIDYCGQEKHLEDFTFNVTENTVAEEEVSSRTREVTEREATIETDMQEGVLVPEEAPVYWRTGAATIKDGEATVEYQAPIFNENEVIKYTVVDDGEVVGTTEVSLQEDPTVLERAYERRFEILAGLLGLSLLANVIMYLKRRKDRSED